MGGTSRVSREAQARFCERLGVKFPGATRRVGPPEKVSPSLLLYRLGVIVFEALTIRVIPCLISATWKLMSKPKPLSARRNGLIKQIPVSPANRRVHAESGVDDLLGNGSPGHCRPLWFLAKTRRRKERNKYLSPG